jgi:hypothetical protein
MKEYQVVVVKFIAHHLFVKEQSVIEFLFPRYQMMRSQNVVVVKKNIC